MAAKRHERTAARLAAVQVLYSGEMVRSTSTQIVEDGLALQEDGVLSDYAVSLIQGVDAHKLGIDSLLDNASDNWALDRMPLVDRSILRMAVFEMLYVDKVPVSVTINEAVELAKELGGEDDSSRFINGILGRIARDLEANGEQEDVPASAAAESEGEGDSDSESSEAKPADE